MKSLSMIDIFISEYSVCKSPNSNSDSDFLQTLEDYGTSIGSSKTVDPEVDAIER